MEPGLGRMDRWGLFLGLYQRGQENLDRAVSPNGGPYLCTSRG